MDFNPADFKIETVSNGSAWVPLASGVRVIHLPTRISAAATSERSQHANKAKAWEWLKDKLQKQTDLTKQLELF